MIMVEGIKKSKREEFQDKIRIFKKNEEAVLDILALYQFMITNGDMQSLVGVNLAEKVIADLENPEVDISYKGESGWDFYCTLNDRRFKLEEEYQKYEECSDLKIQNSYKKSYCFHNLFNNSNYEKMRKAKFNLIYELFMRSPDLANEFLISDISLDIRLEMFVDLLRKACDNPRMMKVLFKFNSNDLSRTSIEKIEEKKQELLGAFRNGKCASYNVDEFLMDVIRENKFDLINSLQKSDLFDFNPIYGKFVSDSDSELDGKVISTVAIICNYDSKRRLDSFRDLYQSSGYNEIPESIRDNNDVLILKILKYFDLSDFVRLPNFRITETKLEIIIKRVREYYEATGSYSDYDRKQIIDAIIRKSKNRKELKQALQYVKRFEEETNFEKEEALELAEQVALEEKRKEFSTMLFRLNETLQETVPGKVLLKNLDFEKKDK